MIGPFNTVDIFILIIITVSLLLGMVKGFLREIFSLIFFVLAIILASLFYSDLSALFVKGDAADAKPGERVIVKHAPVESSVKSEGQATMTKSLDNPLSKWQNRVFEPKAKGKRVADFLAFLAIFFLVLVLGSIVTYFLKKILVRGPMKSVDRILGAFFGLLRGMLICSIIIFGARKIEFKTHMIGQSFIVNVILNDTINLMKGFLPE